MIGTQVFHYQILEKLGAGGMGVVYKALDTRLDRHVAMKFLPHHLGSDEEEKTRFINEAKATSSMDHGNICTIFEIGETDDGQMFIVMGYYDGDTLKARMGSDPMDENDVVEIAAQIADGISRAHEDGIIHRDIKPANIMITSRDDVKILDFGLAKLAGQARVTQAGTTMGTIAYMSPEQSKGNDADHRTDIWSLGVMMYEMLTGDLPFQGAYDAAIVYSIMHEEAEPLSSYVPDINPSLEQVVQKAMAKDPDARYQTMEELRADLKAISSGAQVAVSDQTVLMQTPVEKPGINKILKLAKPVGIGIAVAVVVLLLRPLLFNEATAAAKKTVAVIRFENATEDTSVDYLEEVIANLLITNLEQSQFIRVTTMERLFDLMKQSGKPVTEKIDRATGFELCKMDDVEFIVFGNFRRIEDQFHTTVKVWDVESERDIKTAATWGVGVTSILESQIDELSQNISLGLGLTEQNLQQSQLRIADATTTSMDAYRDFLRGREEFEKFDWDNARSYLERAIHVDSTFAVAHLYLGWTYDYLGNTPESIASFERAKRFANKATEKEQLYIAATYADRIEKNAEQGFQIRQQLVEKYPKEKRAHWELAQYYGAKALQMESINAYEQALILDPQFGFALNELAYTYADLGQYEKALEYFQRYAENAKPDDPNPFDSQGEMYFLMGEYDEAIQKYEEAISILSDFYYAAWSLAYIYGMKEDYAEAINWIDRFIVMAPTPGVRAQGYVWKGIYYYWSGRVQQALSELNRAVESARMAGDNRWIAAAGYVMGWIHFETGNTELSRHYFNAWFRLALTRYVDNQPKHKAERFFVNGLIDVKQNQLSSARVKLDSMYVTLIEVKAGDQNRAQFYASLLKAHILLESGSVDEAVRVTASMQPLNAPVYMKPFWMLFYNLPFKKDVFARAAEKAGDINGAIKLYEGLTQTGPNKKLWTLICPLYHYRLAKLYEQAGRGEEATEQYRRFLEVWKDADPGRPELDEVRRLLGSVSD